MPRNCRFFGNFGEISLKGRPMDSVTLNAYAKINLYLDITGKRPDGYHTLETVMHTVSLCDIVKIEKTAGETEIICSEPSVPCDKSNIAYKCADAFFEHTGISGCGVRISIIKHIPSQAGMGGGSADGAAVLKGLNMLYGTGLSEKELCCIGVRIGADIPFCITGGCGYCTGIGDIITPIPVLSGTVLIGKGSMGISTRDAFAAVDSKKLCPPQLNVKEVFERADIAKISRCCYNAFEAATDLEEVSDIRDIMLKNGALCSCMTGSGSAVFGIYTDDRAADISMEMLRSKGYFSEICSFIKG